MLCICTCFELRNCSFFKYLEKVIRVIQKKVKETFFKVRYLSKTRRLFRGFFPLLQLTKCKTGKIMKRNLLNFCRYYSTLTFHLFSPSKKKRHKIKRAVMATKKCTEFYFIRKNLCFKVS